MACSGAPAPAPSRPAAASAASAPPSSPPPSASSAAPALSPEEQKKLEEAKQLEEDFAKEAEAAKAELARWTPELHAEAKTLAEKTYRDVGSAMKTLLAAKYRKAAHVARDKDRHPAETLAFWGIKPAETVLEIGPGDGWYTELLAPYLAKHGKLLVTSADPDGPKTQRPTLYAQRIKNFLSVDHDLFGKVGVVITGGLAPKLGADASVDVVILARGLHGMQNNKALGAWLGEVHRVLKDKGTLAIEQHRAKEGADPEESAKKGYLPQAWVIAQIEAAGFKLAGKSEVNANAKDTTDHPDGVWNLPPTLRAGDKDKDKYVAIGESDRMTLKFTKVKKP